MSKQGHVKVRLLLVDDGAFHHEEVEVPAAALDRHERLIDCIREDETVQKLVYVDVDRLCSATVVDE